MVSLTNFGESYVHELKCSCYVPYKYKSDNNPYIKYAYRLTDKNTTVSKITYIHTHHSLPCKKNLCSQKIHNKKEIKEKEGHR